MAACFDYYAEIGAQLARQLDPAGGEHQVNFTIKEPFGVVGCHRAVQLPAAAHGLEGGAGAGGRQHGGLQAVASRPRSSTLMLARASSDLPPGVVNVVTGRRRRPASRSPTIPTSTCVAFTGSTAVGKRIAAGAGS